MSNTASLPLSLLVPLGKSSRTIEDDQQFIVHAILTSYIVEGGATMDEQKYQKYKLALLLDWLERKRTLDERNVAIPGSANLYSTRYVEGSPDLICKAVDCGFTTKHITAAVDHLIEHFPTWFIDGGIESNGRRGGKTRRTKESISE